MKNEIKFIIICIFISLVINVWMAKRSVKHSRKIMKNLSDSTLSIIPKQIKNIKRTWILDSRLRQTYNYLKEEGQIIETR